MFKLLKRSKFLFIGSLILTVVLLGIYGVFHYIIKNDAFVSTTTFLYIVIDVGIILPIIIFMSVSSKIEKAARSNYIKVSNTLGADIQEAYNFGQIGLLIYNDDKEIIWASELFEERNIKIIGNKIKTSFPKLVNILDCKEHSEETVSINDRTYRVLCVPEMTLLVFKDISDEVEFANIAEDNKPVIATILLDNLSTVQSVYDVEEFAKQENKVRLLIDDYCKQHEILIKRVRDDTYFCVLNEEVYKEILEDKFSIVDKVLNASKNKDITLTISIGIGRGDRDYIKLSELSADATNVAQSRGGCQVVVENFAGHWEFYGHSQENKIGSNQIKNKVMAQSLYSNINDHKKIFVVPHIDADFDAIGAALGVAEIAHRANKEVHIIADEKQIELKARMMLKDLVDYESYLLSPNKAVQTVNNETLVIVVDVYKPSLTTSPKLLEIAEHVGMIDHHRITEQSIDNPIYNYVDTTASSASEMVTGMIENCPVKISIESNIATCLLAGILLDTRGFKQRTTSNTFKAAMTLNTFGADNRVADSYMKEEFEEFELRTKALSNIEIPKLGFAISTIPDDEYVEKKTLAVIAEQLIEIKDIKCGFVVGKLDKNTIGISARSTGETNVSLIMEKLGGGGHHSEGATQIESNNIEDIKKQLKTTLELYFEEIE